jgi:hypothetical protein
MAAAVDEMLFARVDRDKKMSRLVDAVRMGANVSETCRYVEISRQTWYRWRARGDRGDQPYRQLLEDLRTAEREAANTELRREIDALAESQAQ